MSMYFQHHSYRTFQGITCLVQISTRTEDFIIDGLDLRSDLHLLNEIFTDPNITKVIPFIFTVTDLQLQLLSNLKSLGMSYFVFLNGKHLFSK